MFQKLSCLPYVRVWFSSCPCKVCSCLSEALLLALHTLSLSFLTNIFSSDSKAFLRFILFSGSSTLVHLAFFFFDVKAWPQSQTDLFTCTTVLHYGHTFLTEEVVQVYGGVVTAPKDNGAVSPCMKSTMFYDFGPN